MRRSPVPNLLRDQVVHNGSSSTHSQPLVRWASNNTSSILSTAEFNRSRRVFWSRDQTRRVQETGILSLQVLRGHYPDHELVCP